MGKKGGWFSAVRKAFSPEPKQKKDQKSSKSKKRWFGKPKNLDVISSVEAAELDVEEVKLAEAENEQSKHAYSVALATAVAAEAAVAAAQAAAEVVRLTTISCYSGKSKEEVAAIKIQTAFRGYMSRRALRALRGLVRMKSLIQGQSVKRQATTTLRCMQTLARVQSEVRARRIRMSEENLALQRQLQQRHERELERLLSASVNNEWNDSTKSKEQMEAKLANRQEAATRRERALAYAYSHQNSWKSSSKSVNPTFMDPNNPHWGWSWLERWLAARPWETKGTVDYHDRASVKSAVSHATSIGDFTKAYVRRDLNLDIKPFPMTPTSQKTSRPPSRQSPSTPTKAQSSWSAGRKLKPASPRGSGWGGDEDSRSALSVKSERYRRHSVAGSSVRDDESLASSLSVPSYMASTESARARARLSSPLGMEKTTTTESGGAKKRLSFPASPATTRRHSGPPKIDASPIKDTGMHPEERNYTDESR